MLGIAACAAPVSQIDLGEVKTSYVLGVPSAPVQITEYTDFECEFCGEFHREVWPKIKVKYIDAGKVTYELKNFPITAVHKFALNGAKGAYCAGDQGYYWEFIDMLFTNQDNLRVPDLVEYAEIVGLADLDLFEACVRSDKYQRTVEDDLIEGANRDVKGPPTVFINGQRVDGARDFAYWDEKISGILDDASWI